MRERYYTNCSLCQTKMEVNNMDEVYIHFFKTNDRKLTRGFIVCEKCACGLLQKFVEADPMNRRCNNG